MKKIDVMIVGAEKSGTTSLKNYLNEHPDVFGHSATEFTFFHSKKNELNTGYQEEHFLCERSSKESHKQVSQ